MKITITVILLILQMNSFGQDGSDIRYFEVPEVDGSFVGKYVQFDFYRISCRGQSIDTVTINIEGKPIEFIERRNDTGFNNWFSEQYLQSIDKLIRISK